MKNFQMLFQLRVYCVSLLDNLFPKPNRLPLPTRVGSYRLVKPLKKAGSQQHYRLGLYQNESGNTALGKFWQGKRQTMAYWSLKHEGLVVRSLKLLIQNTKIKTVAVAKLVGDYETKTSLLMLFEWIDGQAVKDEHLIEAYEKALTMFAATVPLLKSRLGASLPIRTGVSLCGLFPFILAKALLTYPRSWLQLLAGGMVFVSKAPLVWQAPARCLAHRDLHAKNMIQGNTRLYIIDHAYTCITLDNYEILTILAANWQNIAVRNHFLRKLQLENKSEKELQLIRALALFIGTHLLTDRSYSNQLAWQYQQYHQFWVNQRRLYLAILALEGEYLALPAYKGVTKVADCILDYLRQLAIREKRCSRLSSTLGSYHLVKPLTKIQAFPFAAGIYQAVDGRLVVAKLWTGRRPDLSFYALWREALILQILTAVYKRLDRNFLRKRDKVRAAEYVGWYQSKTKVALITSYYQGKLVSSLPSLAGQKTCYHHALNAIQSLYDHMNYLERSLMPQKNVWYFMLVYPGLLAVNLIKHPDWRQDLLVGLTYYLRYVWVLIWQPKLSLVHGDLHTDNLIKTKDMIVVIDWEQSMVTYPFLEVITTISSLKNSLLFRQQLWREFDKRHLMTSLARKQFQILTIICSTFNLTSQLPASAHQWYRCLLQWSSNLKDESQSRLKGLQQTKKTNKLLLPWWSLPTSTLKSTQ